MIQLSTTGCKLGLISSRSSSRLFSNAELGEDGIEQIVRRRFAAPSRWQVLPDKFFRLDGLRFVAGRFQHIKMMVLRNHEIRLGGDGAIAKFVVVRVS